MIKSRPKDFQKWQAMKDEQFFEPMEEANPYLKFMLALVGNDHRMLTDKATAYLLSIFMERANKELTTEREEEYASVYRFMYPHYCRNELMANYASSVPCKRALETIAKYGGPLIEIGAGAGYWAYNMDIVAYDKVVQPRTVLHFPVQEGTEEKILDHPDRTLFLCCPPDQNDDPMAENCLKNYQGKYLILVGSLDQVVKEDYPFAEVLKKHWKLREEVPLPVYFHKHDCLMIFERRHELTSSETDKYNKYYFRQ